jgi:uncharacterized protein (TIGR02246 family)
MTRFIMIIGLVFLCVCPAFSQQSEQYVREEAAIRNIIQEYVDAFNRGDVKALTALWDEDAEYTSSSGERIQGRGQIEAALEKFFSNNKGVKIDLPASEITVSGPENASEEGSSVVTFPDGNKDESNYVVRYVRQGENWRIAKACETPETPSNYGNLKQLEWLTGQWVDDQKQAKMEISCDWSQNRNFISLSFRNKISDCETLEGTQVIGWDASAKKVKSWVFDSLGGFAEGVWSGNSPRWTVKTSGVLIDGIKTSATNIFSYVDENTFTFSSIHRKVGGKRRPDIVEVKMVRKLPNLDKVTSP